MKKILIIGIDGQLGFDLFRVLSKVNDVSGAGRIDLDVSDKLSVQKFFKNKDFDVVINTAAFHKVDVCEEDPQNAFLVNAVGAFHVAFESSKIGATTVFISTDYVFDGSRKEYSEDDVPLPLNVYGSSKLAGEYMTKIANPRAYIIRTSALFGIHKGGKGYNFVTLMLEKAKNSSRKIEVVNDLFFSPTSTLDLAHKISELISIDASFGTYHITNQGSCSWYEFAVEIFKIAKLYPNIVPVKWRRRDLEAKRPLGSVLVNKRLQQEGISLLQPWSRALSQYMTEFNNFNEN